MLSTLQVVAPSAVEPISLDLAKLHCRIDNSSDDTLVGIYLRAARAMAEMYLGRALITQTLLWTMTPEMMRRPSRHYLRGYVDLPRSPVQSIKAVTVLDDRGNLTAISPAVLPVVPPETVIGYIADLSHSPARLVIGDDTPLIDGRTLEEVNLENVQVTFVAGYGATGAAVPQPISDAILLLTAFLYENRGDAGGDMPRAAEWLMDPYRMMFVS